MEIKVKKIAEILDLINKIDQKVNDKLSYAAKKWKKNYDLATKEKFEEANEEVEEAKIMMASVDKDGNLIMGANNQYCYKPEKLIEFNKKIKEVNKKLNDKTIDFTPYLVEDINAPGFERIKDIFDEEQMETLLKFFIEDIDKEKEAMNQKLKKVK